MKDRRKNVSEREFVDLCKKVVKEYFNERADKTNNAVISTDDVYIVWLCKSLQNWKALVSTSVLDGMYYELTYNGDRYELYLDAYKKWENKVINV